MYFIFFAVCGGLLFFLASRFLVKKQFFADSIVGRPIYYYWYCACWCVVPTLLIWGIWHLAKVPVLHLMIEYHFPIHFKSQEGTLLIHRIQLAVNGLAPANNDIAELVMRYRHLQQLADLAFNFVFWFALISGGSWALLRLRKTINAQKKLENFIRILLLLCSAIAVFTTFGIVFSLLSESWLFFQKVSPLEFFFSTEWSPQTALRQDQVGSSGAFGAIPLLSGTLLITSIVLFVSVPIGLMTALYLSEIAPQQVRSVIKPILEILAGIPTVVYGFFAALTIAPLIVEWSAAIGIEASSENALAAGITMGIMIIPFVSSLSDDAIHAVPQTLRDGSYALGATTSETILKIILPAALPGIAGSILLAMSRAIGETMIVLMAAGLAANLTANPFASVTTVTVQIVNLLQGDQEFDNPKTLAAFALGITLFCITLILNTIALHIVRRYREKYE